MGQPGSNAELMVWGRRWWPSSAVEGGREGGGPVVSWCGEAPEVVTAMGGAGGTKGKAAVSGGYWDLKVES
jgi:hypothetical protein